ncbi:IS1595 family transposase [Candidatus Amoebophilus asiaticus]|nr:IS1595 family transposase [Candidatus Amoebophilus asiaticus]
MRILKELNRESFDLKFGLKDECLAYLAKGRWKHGYKCATCGSIRYIKGKQNHSRRCKSCGYDESPTANTMFHKLKFGIHKAFGMLYDIATSKKGANSIWLAERYGVKQQTAWLFRQKAQVVMKSSNQYPLEDEVHVDEFEIGTPQEGEQGRSKSVKKMRIVIAVECRNGKCGRGYAQVIKDYSSESLRKIFDDHIASNASILADGWCGYKPLKDNYPSLKQQLSEKGRNFPMIHIQIRNFKNWLRGVHSYCNNQYLDKYISEYFFRFNRRNNRRSILDKLLIRMISNKPLTLTEIQLVAT